MQEGIYKYIRHPSYTGSIIILSGFACIDIKLFAIYFSWVFFKTRIIEEERHLTNWFGQKYVDYKQKTGELFPKIRRSENA